jgi:hypothetical protein
MTTEFLVDGPLVTIHAPREARPGETVWVDGNEPTEITLPPTSSCPGAGIEIKETADGEEPTMVRPAPGDTIEGRPELRITGGVAGNVRRYVLLRSNGAGDWRILGHHGLR